MPIYPEDSWVAGRAQVNGHELVIRARAQRPTAELRAACPHLLIVTWKFGETSTGMPTAEEDARVLELEASLDAGMYAGMHAGMHAGVHAGIDGTEAGVLAAVITGNGGKEWLYYTSDPDRFMEAFNLAVSGREPYPLAFEGLVDTEWKALAELVG